MNFSKSLLKQLQAFYGHPWTRDLGLLFLCSLLAYIPATISVRLLRKRWDRLRISNRALRTAWAVLEASIWPLWAILFLYLAFAAWVFFQPESHGQPEKVLPLLGFFLFYRILTALMRETLPSEEKYRTVRKAALILIFGLAALQQVALLGPVVSWLKHPLITIGQTEISLLSIVIAVLVAALSFLVARIAARFLRSKVLTQMGVEQGLSESLSTLVRYIIGFVGIMVALESLGFDLSTLKIVLGALGVGIGFGLQNVVNNFVSGIIILAERMVKRGDIIAVGQTDGRVMRIGLRSSVVRTRAGMEIIVPNSDFVSSQVTNFSYRDRLVRVDLPVGVSYASDPNQVREILLQAAAEEDRVLQNPSPDVLFIQYGNSSIDFQLRVWIDDPWVRPLVRSALYFSIWYKLKNAGIEIPFPQQDLHFRSGELKVRIDPPDKALPTRPGPE